MMILRSSWSLEDYAELLSMLRSEAICPVDLQAYACGSSGVWIRHDVELDMAAAVRMAQLEHDLGLATCYYVCVDSPLIALPDAVLFKLMRQVEAFGHAVSFHLITGPGHPPVDEQLRELRCRFPAVKPASLTFHAPGCRPGVLSGLPLGDQVYGPIAVGAAQYYSDSTGRWRWGHPADSRGIAKVARQVLIHPFWWARKEIEVDPAMARAFLPQLAQELPATSA